MVDSVKKLSTLIVLVILIGCNVVSSFNYRRPSKVDLECCEKVSKALIPRKIQLTAFKHQNALSPCVEAIIFYSEDEKYCSDPTAKWIEKKQKGLRELKG